jgi:MFS family permease
LGYHVGALAASFCGAQFFSSVLWGKISDKYGRKPAIIIGTFGTIFGMLIFGTAKSYGQAVFGRILSGLLSGNLGVMESFLTEFTDDSN